jgi:4-hydroxy-2-oxoglutarate aldolase
MVEFRGVFVPSITPFDRFRGEVDLVALRRHVRYLLESDLAGVVLFGSTGEGLLLDENERTAALQAVREVMGDRLLLAGAAAESTRATCRLARDAAHAGADAVMVAPPAYYRPQMTPEALREHYRAVADASPIPILLYQVPPAYSGIQLQAGLVAELANHPNIAGIKDSTGDLQALGGLVETCRSDFAVLVGSGAVLFGALEVGACGGIVAVANLAPAECGQLFGFHREGGSVEAGALQERLAPLHKSVVGTYGVPGVKAALDLLGQTGGPPRAPLKPLREKDVAVVRAALDRAGIGGGELSAIS